MSRSGLVEADDCDNYNLYRANVRRSIRGKKGQAFLREMADAMDSMPVKELIAEELIDEEGNCCAIGTVCKSRGLSVKSVDSTDPESVGKLVGISRLMAAEIEFENDDDFGFEVETPAKRWTRMRKWIDSNLVTP